MPSFNDVVPGSSADSSCVQQLVDALKGTAGQGVPISITAVSDAANFALDVRNTETGNGRAFRVRDSSNATQIQCDVNGVLINQAIISSGTITGSTVTNSRLTNANVSTTSPGVLSARLDSTVLTAAAATMTLTVTSSAYKHLELRVFGSIGTLTAPAGDSVLMQFNSDTAANYDVMRHYISTVSGVIVSADAGSTAGALGIIPGSSGAAAMSGQISADINSYGANAAMHHTAHSRWAAKGNTSTTAIQLGNFCSFWRSTAGITSVLLFLSAGGSFSSGTRAELYGRP